jgi:hypothetical protein
MLQEDLEIAIDHGIESTSVDYKASFDATAAADWLEVAKDIVALANSGGGAIIFGIADDGTASAFDCAALNALDPATVTDKIFRYTGQQFRAFTFLKAVRKGRPLFAIAVERTSVPIAFSKPGTYDVGGGKQKTAFSAGTVYFRHGAKSEPGNSDDLREFVEYRIEEMRKAWFEGIVKVVEAPAGAHVQVIVPDQAVPARGDMRLVNDPTAPAYRPFSVDETHPFRQKEVVEEFHRLTGGTKKIIAYNIQCVRQTHRIDDNPTFCYKQKHASALYSRAFVDWIVRSYHDNPDFFENAKHDAEQARRTSTVGK